MVKYKGITDLEISDGVLCKKSYGNFVENEEYTLKQIFEIWRLNKFEVWLYFYSPSERLLKERKDKLNSINGKV